MWTLICVLCNCVLAVSEHVGETLDGISFSFRQPDRLFFFLFWNVLCSDSLRSEHGFWFVLTDVWKFWYREELIARSFSELDCQPVSLKVLPVTYMNCNREGIFFWSLSVFENSSVIFLNIFSQVFFTDRRKTLYLSWRDIFYMDCVYMEAMTRKHPACDGSSWVDLSVKTLISFTSLVTHAGKAQTH